MASMIEGPAADAPAVHGLVEAFNQEEPTLVHRLHTWVASCPDRHCLHHGDTSLSLSFAQFDAVTDTLASYLSSLGVQAGDRVAVCADSALVSALAMFGIWKVGAAFCPLNTQLPPDLLAYMLGDLSPAVVLADDALEGTVAAAQFCESDSARLILCAAAEIAAGHLALRGRGSDADTVISLRSPPEPPGTDTRLVKARADQPASVIYTSGTTSAPKGVIQRHSGLHALCATQSIWTDPEDVVHCDLPMYHLGGAFSLFARGLWCGAAVALWDRFSASQYWQRIDHYGATIALLLDVMMDWLMQRPVSEAERRNTLAKVHLQPLGPDFADLAQRFDIDLILAGYGSSELGNAMLGCIDIFPQGKTPEEGPGQQKPPWRGTAKQTLLDRVRQRHGDAAVLSVQDTVTPGLMGVPSGFYTVALEEDLSGERSAQGGVTKGRLRLTPLIEGVLFDGYLNQNESAGAAEPDVRSYLAPDYASIDESGRYYFAERKEGLLRVKGENVSAAAVERVFLEHPSIAGCVVLGVPAKQGGENDIVAFVQPMAGAQMDPETLLGWSDSRLAHYMQPKTCLILDAMPLTGTLKIDRGALRKQALELQANW